MLILFFICVGSILLKHYFDIKWENFDQDNKEWIEKNIAIENLDEANEKMANLYKQKEFYANASTICNIIGITLAIVVAIIFIVDLITTL